MVRSYSVLTRLVCLLFWWWCAPRISPQLPSGFSPSLFYVRNVHQGFDQASRLLFSLTTAKVRAPRESRSERSVNCVSENFRKRIKQRQRPFKEIQPAVISSNLLGNAFVETWWAWTKVTFKCIWREVSLLHLPGWAEVSIRWLWLKLKEAVKTVCFRIQSRTPYCSTLLFWAAAICLVLNFSFSHMINMTETDAQAVDLQ